MFLNNGESLSFNSHLKMIYERCPLFLASRNNLFVSFSAIYELIKLLSSIHKHKCSLNDVCEKW